MIQELKPCPFCGGEAVIHHRKEAGNVVIMCQDCGSGTIFLEEKYAIALWNRRTSDD